MSVRRRRPRRAAARERRTAIDSLLACSTRSPSGPFPEPTAGGSVFPTDTTRRGQYAGCRNGSPGNDAARAGGIDELLRHWVSWLPVPGSWDRWFRVPYRSNHSASSEWRLSSARSHSASSHFWAFSSPTWLAGICRFVSPALHDILTKADAGPLGLVLSVALVNGLGEELFFRGALYGALGSHHPVAGSTILYIAVTAATGNIALVVAAAVMGSLFSLQRKRTGAVLAPTVTHLCWSTLMVLALAR